MPISIHMYMYIYRAHDNALLNSDNVRSSTCHCAGECNGSSLHSGEISNVMIANQNRKKIEQNFRELIN